MKRLEAELVAEQDFESQRETKSAVMKLDDLDMGILERRAELERTWDRGAEGLMDLGKIPGVMAKLDRAEKAVGVVQDNIRK